jgi:hypothetical protein
MLREEPRERDAKVTDQKVQDEQERAGLAGRDAGRLQPRFVPRTLQLSAQPAQIVLQIAGGHE